MALAKTREARKRSALRRLKYQYRSISGGQRPIRVVMQSIRRMTREIEGWPVAESQKYEGRNDDSSNAVIYCPNPVSVTVISSKIHVCRKAIVSKAKYRRNIRRNIGNRVQWNMKLWRRKLRLFGRKYRNGWKWPGNGEENSGYSAISAKMKARRNWRIGNRKEEENSIIEKAIEEWRRRREKKHQYIRRKWKRKKYKLYENRHHRRKYLVFEA